MPRKLHARFNAILPRIVRHARCYFRWIKCWHTKEDKVQEVQSLCWHWVKKLHKLGRKWTGFVSRLADFACRQVRCGRKIAGSTSIKDVMNEIAQARHGFYVGKLPDFSTESENPLSLALTDNTQTPVDDAVAFRIDLPAWLKTRTDADRLLINDMMLGHRTKDLAQRYGKSQGRISQQRGEFHEDWENFCALPEA